VIEGLRAVGASRGYSDAQSWPMPNGDKTEFIPVSFPAIEPSDITEEEVREVTSRAALETALGVDQIPNRILGDFDICSSPHGSSS
jgi:hypothetical protein